MRPFRNGEFGAAMRVMAGMLGVTAVALGAFGMHALKPMLAVLVTMKIWRTALLSHLTRPVRLVCIALARPVARLGVWFFVTDTHLFSDSLYFLH